MRLYLGNKMVGIENFNAAWFDDTEQRLLALPIVDTVFNPAQHDRDEGFLPEGLAGTLAELKDAGFDRRAALTFDWQWIGTHSDGMIVGPDWKNSPETISEVACHQALFLPVWPHDVFITNWESLQLRKLALKPILQVGCDGLTCDC